MHFLLSIFFFAPGSHSHCVPSCPFFFCAPAQSTGVALFTIGASFSLRSISGLFVDSARALLYVADAAQSRVCVFAAGSSSSSSSSAAAASSSKSSKKSAAKAALDLEQAFAFQGVLHRDHAAELGALQPQGVAASGALVCVADAARHQVLVWTWPQ
jgi:hypothetical protein